MSTSQRRHAVLQPPIKTQGGKARLIPFLRDNLGWRTRQRWVEPFVGGASLPLNLRPERALLADANPHLIELYQALQSGRLTPTAITAALAGEAEELRRCGAAHYYLVRERFNREPNSTDFLFLNHAGFNGLMRFNRRGDFNTPFGHQPEKFSRGFVAQLEDRLAAFAHAAQSHDWTFVHQPWQATLAQWTADDFVYADPPYVGRHTTYYTGWDAGDAAALAQTLRALPVPWALSDWAEDAVAGSPRLAQLYPEHVQVLKEHRFVVGAAASSRRTHTEALVLSRYHAGLAGRADTLNAAAV